MTAVQIIPDHGFLPRQDPLQNLPGSHAAWDELGHELPQLLAARRVRGRLEELPVLDVEELDSRELERAMLLLSFFGHAAVWESPPKPHSSIPRGVAVPWVAVAARLGRPLGLAYASHALHNWRRLDPAGPIGLGNLTTLQTFLGGRDEEWFILLHVAIEADAVPGLLAISAAQRVAADDRADRVGQQLRRLAEAQAAMYATLLRMPEGCDPQAFFTRIQPYLHGTLQAPVVLEGVAAFDGRPQAFAGSSAAQGLLLPTLDAALGITHAPDELAAYLERLHQHAPAEHHAIRETIARGPSIRAYVQRRGGVELRDAYNDCVSHLSRFRRKHVELTAQYVEAPARKLAGSAPEHGTGGTPFMRFLDKFAAETAAHLLDGTTAC